MKPLLTKAQSSSAAAASYAEQRSKLEARMAEVSTNLVRTAFGDPRRLAGVYLFATTLPAKDARAYLTNNTADPDLLQNWQRIARIGGRRDGGIFRIWQMAQRIPQGRFAEQTRRALAGLGQDDRTRNLPAPVIQVFRGKAPRNIAELAAMYGQLFAHPDAEWQETLNSLLAEVAVNIVPNRQRGAYFIAREQLDRLEMVHEGAPARAMALYDSGSPRDSRIFVRGEAENPGPVVPRRFLEILSPTNRPVFTQGSGRLQLAQAISTSPLSYRTMANRIWQHHFGQGLVITPDDLGTQSTPPSHPELLEWLASQLQRNGGSIKALHKQLMLSDTYRRSSKPSPDAETRDPDNRLLSHSNVRRLEFEPLRDSILLVGGKLDLTIGGKPVDLSEGTHRSSGRRGGAMADRLSGGATRMSTAERRTVYGFVDREDLWEMLTVFDFANPSISSGKRYETTVPQQALFLMNSPLVVEQARNVTEREDFTKLRDEKERIHYLYSLLFQRIPTETEIQSGNEFVANWAPSSTTGASVSPNTSEGSAAQATRKRARAASPPSKPSKPLTAWAEYTHALFLTTEMSFVH
ncbi:MAG: DUF1553 domain-containing protein [Verrucomicrobia bacterium]|nr:DUF1553 domain-containing protein [Verrucomicrobiota bacterium]